MTDDYILINRQAWNEAADEFAGYAEHTWAAEEPIWGIFSVPDSEVGMMPADPDGKRVLEAGCGTGYVSAWMARRGAQPIGVDNSPRQLATAARFQDQYDLVFPLIHGTAENLPFQAGTFDIVISEYGASLWSDPYRWIPEAARVLRPDGELVFLTSTAFVTMFVFDDETVPADTTLKRDYFGSHSQEWPDDPGVEFHLTHGDWFRNLHNNGFEVVDLVEIQPGPDATTTYPWVTPDWARRWPVEEVWKAKRRS